MAALTFDLDIWIDGRDEPLRVRADQRELAGFEAEYKMSFSRGLDEMPMVFFRFLGYGAAKRLGKIDKDAGREDWLSTVAAVDSADDDEAEPVDPGSPAASEGPLST